MSPHAFLSYAHADDDFLDNGITWIRIELEKAVRILTGQPFTIFQDKQGIAFGEHWPQRLEESLKSAAFLIPVLTPSFFSSSSCCNEVSQFLHYESAANRSDLILPIYLINADILERPELYGPSDLARLLRERQFADWRSIAFELKKTLLTKQHIIDFSRHIALALKRSTAIQNQKIAAIPSRKLSAETLRDTGDIIKDNYAKSDALITISTHATMIVSDPKRALIGFRNIINSLWEINRDNRNRILIWVLDFGQQSFGDEESRVCFLNVEALKTRFRALKIFDDLQADLRWQWLQSCAVIILRDRRKAKSSVSVHPRLDAEHILLNTIPGSWVKTPALRLLYGEKFERIEDRNYTIFLNLQNCSGADPSATSIKYYGHAPINGKIRGAELPLPHGDYERAALIIYHASCYELGNRFGVKPLIEGRVVAKQLRHLGFSILRLNRFIGK